MIGFSCSGPRPFRAKNHNEEHSPSCPSIKKMSHFVRSRKELENCPVVNWEVFHKRRLERDGGASGYLGERSQADMYTLFRCLGWSPWGEPNTIEVAVRPHQMKKVSVSLCGKYWSKAKDLSLEALYGK